MTSSCYVMRISPTACTYRSVQNSGQTTVWQEFLLIISLQYIKNILEALLPGGVIGEAAIVPHFYTSHVRQGRLKWYLISVVWIIVGESGDKLEQT